VKATYRLRTITEPGELNVVWDELFPAFHSGSLPPDPIEEGKLKETLGHLQVHGSAAK
jgi:hypothetical protein